MEAARKITVERPTMLVIEKKVAKPTNQELKSWFKEMMDLKEHIATLDAAKEAISKKFKAHMRAEGIDTIRVEKHNMHLLKDIEVTTVDSKRLAKEKPEIYEEYSKTGKPYDKLDIRVVKNVTDDPADGKVVLVIE
jgi:phosphopantetheinyl transferase (holo-ACP synthase)